MIPGQFKKIIEKNCRSEYWIKAGQDLGLTARFLAAGDAAFAETHAVLRAGSFPSTGAPLSAPIRRIPSPALRFISFYIGSSLSLLIGIFTLTGFWWFALFVLNRRGQWAHQWFFGTKFVTWREGRNPGWAMTTLGPLLPLIAFPALVSLALALGLMRWQSMVAMSTYLASIFPPFNVVHLAVVNGTFGGSAAALLMVPILVGAFAIFLNFFNILSCTSDPEARTLLDKFLGVVVVFAEPDQ